MDRWLAEPEDPQPQLRAVLFTKVTLALMSGRPAAEFLDAQRARHLATMRALTAARRDAASAAGGEPWSPPDLGLVALPAGSALAAMAVTTAALPLMNVTTRYDAVRFE
ncbi:hypothetical protein [Nonomuraea rubra]|uniref:Uncharacterized protein n=1 Tax=Nonomuraea rubra TaxID=46180 RepID=A0A7X0P871_9ACTN|nr:hypothetical protein [Nonomuraea rubra]MBB6557078.1 hypothetical protein [Nonomuraea rubra]